MLKNALTIIAASPLLFGSHTSTAQAQTDAVAAASGIPTGGAGGRSGWANQWGIGVIANPEFVGSDDYNVLPIPYLDFRYRDELGDRFFANIPQGIGGYAFRWRGAERSTFLNIGGAVARGFNVRDDTIEGLKEIDAPTEARIYLEAGLGSWVASATVAQDIGSGHEGAYLDLSLNLRGRIGEGGGFYAVGPVLRVGDEQYKESFFSVSPEESEASGLPEYAAGAGVERVGLQGLLSLPVGQSKWRWTALMRVSQLVDDAADSPIVNNETQLFFLTAFTRSF